MATKVDASTLLKNKPLPNYILIEFGYDNKMVFPYKDGIKVLELMEFYEQYDTSDYANPIIVPSKLSRTIEIKIMSGAEYLDLKAKALLRVPSESK